MATIRQYYETDFDNTIKVYVKIPFEGDIVEACVLFDFSAYCSFYSCYFQLHNKNIEYYIKFIQGFQRGIQVESDGKVLLPSLRSYHGSLKFDNTGELKIFSQFYGEQEWKSTKELAATRRVFIFSENDYSNHDLSKLA